MSNSILAQTGKYLIVGGFCTIVDMGLLYLLTGLGVHYLISAVISFTTGVTLNYFMCTAWIFDESKVKVFYTRTEDKHVPLKERSLLANALKADLFISIHNNSQGEEEFSEYNGTMVLFSEGGLKDSKTLARKCLTHVLKNTGSKDQGLVQGDYVYIVRSSEVPVALIEVGFMTNEAELDRLSSVSYQKKVAKGVFDAIMEAFEEGL